MDYSESTKTKMHFWTMVYRAALLALLTFIAVVATIGVRRVFDISHQVDNRTRDIQNQMQCIGQYFNQQERQNLVIKTIDDCTITRVK